MSLRLVDDRGDGTIHPAAMRDGQVGKITSHAMDSFIGVIVERCGDYLAPLNKVMTGGTSPRGVWRLANLSETFHVRVLPNGTRLEVTDNE